MGLFSKPTIEICASVSQIKQLENKRLKTYSINENTFIKQKQIFLHAPAVFQFETSLSCRLRHNVVKRQNLKSCAGHSRMTPKFTVPLSLFAACKPE